MADRTAREVVLAVETPDQREIRLEREPGAPAGMQRFVLDVPLPQEHRAASDQRGAGRDFVLTLVLSTLAAKLARRTGAPAFADALTREQEAELARRQAAERRAS